MRKTSLAVMLAAVMGSALVVWVPELWPSLLFEMVGFALALAWFLALVTGKAEARWSLPLFALVGVVVWAVIQVYSGLTVYRWKTQVAALSWTANAAYFFAATQVFTEQRLRRTFLGAMIALGTLLALVSSAQYFTSPSQIFWLFDSPLDIGAVMGPFLNRNHYAAFMELLLPVAMYRALADENYGPWYAVATGVLFASVIASSSRAGAALSVVELLAVPALLWHRRSIGMRVALPAIGALALSIGGLVLAAGYETLFSRLSHEDLYAGRREFYLSSIAMAKDHLWTGVGLGNWATVYPRYALFDDGNFVNQAHNDWAQWLAEGGVPMLLLMAFIAVWAVPRALRSVWGIGVIAILLHSWVDFSIQRTPVAILFFVMLGALEFSGRREHARGLV